MSAFALFTVLAGSSVLAGCQARAQIKVATAPPPPPPAPPPPAPAPAPVQVGKIELPGELEFDSGRATIKGTASSNQILEALLDTLKKHPEITKLRIEGHTDNVGRPATNQQLSEERAAAVANWLVGRSVDKSRLFTVGFGETRPLVDNDSAERRQTNRRTEFHVEEVNGKPPAPEQIASNR